MCKRYVDVEICWVKGKKAVLNGGTKKLERWLSRRGERMSIFTEQMRGYLRETRNKEEEEKSYPRMGKEDMG